MRLVGMPIQPKRHHTDMEAGTRTANPCCRGDSLEVVFTGSHRYACVYGEARAVLRRKSLSPADLPGGKAPSKSVQPINVLVSSIGLVCSALPQARE